MAPRSITILISPLLLSLVASCSKQKEEIRAYQAACEGHPLLTMERRYKAIEDGYLINREYDCIDKASFVAVREERAKWEAANTPAAIARREADFAQQSAHYAEQRARAAAEEVQARESPSNIVLHDVDVNTATEEDIAKSIGVGPGVAAHIIEERNKRRFDDWPDLVSRVIGLSAAQTAVYASICGLSVNGKSLDGAPPNATMAAAILKKYQRNPSN